MISIGSKEMVDCQVGSKKVKEIYVGSKKVWPSWNLLYEADVRGGGDNGTTVLATIPNFVSKTTKIKVVVTYKYGTWKKGSPIGGAGEQALEFGVPPKSTFVEFNADVSPLSIQYTSGNTSYFLSIEKSSPSDNTAYSDTSWQINPQGQLTKYIGTNLSYLSSDPVHLQVYYQ